MLVVEDDAPLREFTRDCLERCGYTVLAAQHPEEALDTAAHHAGVIHLMVTDVVMPRMNGYELARRLEPVRPEMKVLYVSGYTEHAGLQQGKPEGALAYLQKPFTIDGLARRVRQVLDADAVPSGTAGPSAS